MMWDELVPVMLLEIRPSMEGYGLVEDYMAYGKDLVLVPRLPFTATRHWLQMCNWKHPIGKADFAATASAGQTGV